MWELKCEWDEILLDATGPAESCWKGRVSQTICEKSTNQSETKYTIVLCDPPKAGYGAVAYLHTVSENTSSNKDLNNEILTARTTDRAWSNVSVVSFPNRSSKQHSAFTNKCIKEITEIYSIQFTMQHYTQPCQYSIQGLPCSPFDRQQLSVKPSGPE